VGFFAVFAALREIKGKVIYAPVLSRKEDLMSILFSGSEVVDLCIEIEKNGAAFYHALAESAKSEEVRKCALYFEGEEKKHQATFERMLGVLKDYA